MVCDGLKGLPDAVGQVWPRTIVQTCIVHLLRNSFRYASRRDWARSRRISSRFIPQRRARGGGPVRRVLGKWEKRYPAIMRLWNNAWAEFVPFLRFDREIRTVICTTNAIECINARMRRAVNARGHFPTEQAALKCLYLAIIEPGPHRTGTPAVDQPVEGRPERLRHHLRRPPQRGTQVTTRKKLHRSPTPLERMFCVHELIYAYRFCRHSYSICAGGCVAGRGDLQPRLGFLSARTDSHLTYMIDIALTTEFSLAAGGAR